MDGWRLFVKTFGCKLLPDHVERRNKINIYHIVKLIDGPRHAKDLNIKLIYQKDQDEYQIRVSKKKQRFICTNKQIKHTRHISIHGYITRKGINIARSTRCLPI